ncbi:hypothetical protein HY991_01395 [Candidatus Micrarchaeota archaeon]|nr:hypothetical protein [Candidatus Micrarchaeota archaeon]
MENEQTGELETCKTRLAFYKKIIEKYEEFINSSEEKTIPELKLMISDSDETIAQFKKEILGQLGVQEASYSYERDFLKYAERTYSLVQSFHPVHSDISVSFWLSYRDTAELKAADSFDKVLFLCSLLLAGGCKNAKIRVLEMEGGFKHPVLIFFFAEKQYLFDPSQECSAFTFQGPLEEILLTFTYEGRKFVKSLYEFNREDYFEFE